MPPRQPASRAVTDRQDAPALLTPPRTFGADDRIGGAAVLQDRAAWPTSWARCRCAGAARLGRHAGRAALSRNAAGDAGRALSDAQSAAIRPMSGIFEAPIGARRARAAHRRARRSTTASICTPPQAGDYPDNARRFGCSCARRSSSSRGAGRADRRPCARLAGGSRCRLPETLYASHPVLGGTPTVFTIHNLAYQGLFEPDWLPRLDLPWQLVGIDGMEFWGKISFLKGGINDADAITTVSPQYAREIQTPEFGCGFDGILSTALAGPGRDSERHRRRTVGSGARSASAGTFSADESQERGRRRPQCWRGTGCPRMRRALTGRSSA